MPPRTAIASGGTTFTANGKRYGIAFDTWYVYPGAEDPDPLPATLPFHTLPNIVMTPPMSGWTHGAIRRRQQTIAENINRLGAGQSPVNIVYSAAR